jgi:uncharacterized membrane protein
MIFDIHPLVIHYPIAFLTVYSLAELLRFRKFMELPYWFFIKASLVIIGTFSAIVTYIFALLSPALQMESRLVDMYKIFMLLTAILFSVIAYAYLYEWKRPGSSSLARFILRPKIIVTLSLVGMFLIVLAGGLFGATIYGTHFDPYLKPFFLLLGVY